MGAVDLTFRAIGAETMKQYWPVFAAGAAIEVWLVGRIRRSGRFRVAWIAFISVVTMVLVAALWGESFLAAQLGYQTAGEGVKFDVWRDLGAHFARTRPLLLPLGVVLLLALVRRPRSDAVMGGLVATGGALVSWIVAMWLFTTNHQPVVFRLLILPGGIGVLASLIGFAMATACWMAMSRWMWKEGRRRRRSSSGSGHGGVTAHADGNLPDLRR